MGFPFMYFFVQTNDFQPRKKKSHGTNIPRKSRDECI